MKKIIKNTIIVVAIAFALALIGLAVILFCGNQITVAHCAVSESDYLYMIYEDRPVRIDTDNESGYQTGDRLLIIHANEFFESYPEQARAIFVMKIGTGTEADIPQKALEIITDVESVVALEMPEDTTLEFWITEDVGNVDFSQHSEIHGWMGAREFLGKGYEAIHIPGEGDRHPRHYVSYIITDWPDYESGGRFVTDIEVTDPTVTVYGLTVGSSFEEFDAVFKAMGYELSWADGAIKTRVAKKGRIKFTLTRAVWDNPQVIPKIRISAKVTNHSGIMF